MMQVFQKIFVNPSFELARIDQICNDVSSTDMCPTVAYLIIPENLLVKGKALDLMNNNKVIR